MVATLDHDEGRISIYAIEGSSVSTSSIAPSVLARSAALNRNGTRLAIGMKNGGIALYRWRDVKWEEEWPPWSVHSSEVAGIRFSDDDRFIVSYGSGGGGSDRSLALFRRLWTNRATDPSGSRGERRSFIVIDWHGVGYSRGRRSKRPSLDLVGIRRALFRAPKRRNKRGLGPLRR